jgi:hypothetical protein
VIIVVHHNGATMLMVAARKIEAMVQSTIPATTVITVKITVIVGKREGYAIGTLKGENVCVNA